jgi:hypothetical protein
MYVWFGMSHEQQTAAHAGSTKKQHIKTEIGEHLDNAVVHYKNDPRLSTSYNST